MKKLLYFAAAALMMFAICSCGKDGGSSSSSSVTVTLTHAGTVSSSELGIDLSSFYMKGKVEALSTVSTAGFYVSANSDVSNAKTFSAQIASDNTFSCNPLLSYITEIGSTVYVQAYANVNGKEYRSSTKKVNVK